MEGFVLKPFPYGDTEKTGFVHQLHAGATWMKHPWKMFRNGVIEHHRLFLNLETMKIDSINI